MEFWLDTADIEFLKNVEQLGIMFGVTTNPSILASAKQPPLKVISQLLDLSVKHVAVQVTANTAEGMIKQAQQLHSLDSKKIIVKIPTTDTGLKAMRQMRKENIRIMATAIYTANQVLLAGIAGAEYVAPYLGGIEQASGDYLDELELMLKIIQHQQFATKIIAAAIRDTRQVTVCAALGVPAITLPAPIFSNLTVTNSLTQTSLDKFEHDWQNVKDPLLFA